LVTGNIVPGGTRNNLDYVNEFVEWDSGISEMDKLIFADAQTSGGLMISLPSDDSERFLNELQVNGVSNAAIIGRFTSEGKKILVTVGNS